MSLKIDRVQLEIVIQQDSARQKMMELEEKMRATKRELKGLKEGAAEYIAKHNDLKAAQKEYDALFEKIGIGSLSIKELRKRQQELNAILKQLPGDSPLYAQYNKQLGQINARLKELKTTSQETHFSLSKMADGFNKYAAMGASAIASLTGVTMAVRKSVDDYAKLEEAEADVRKYTGMTREQVKELNEEFQKMDTRTARTELNSLAADAGRLGITSKKDLLEFAEAGDIIRISLGEDLGKDAIKNIGKLSQMFGDADQMGLKKAMLSVGSAVNEVAQNSSAAEPYLVDFTARLAGVGNQANMSVSQIMGFASVLDQNMQQVEMSSTALQGVIMKMFKDPAKLASIAGLEVKSFTELVEKDANEALLQLLETLGKVGGMNKLAPIFDEMKLDGARAASVLSVLAGNIDKVRSEQELATSAFNDGTSVINEFNVKNTTLQAGLDKAKNKFQEVSYELGKKLSPYMGNVITGAGTLIRALITLTGFIISHQKSIGIATASLVTYTIAIKAHTLWTNKMKTATGEYVIILKLKNGWDKVCAASTLLHSAAIYALKGNTDLAKQSISAFFRVLKLNPFSAVLTALVAVTGALYLFSRRTDSATLAQQKLEDVRKKAIANITTEKTNIEQLYKTASDETTSKENRLAAIKKLNEVSPEYLGYLDLENIRTQQAKKSIDKYIESLIKKATIETQLARIAELNAKMAKYGNDPKEYLDKEVNVFKLLWNGFTSGSAVPEWDEWVEEKKKIEQDLKATQESLFNDKNVRSIELVTNELEIAKKRHAELNNMSAFDKEKLDYDYNQILGDVKNKIKQLEEEKKKLSGNVPLGNDDLSEEERKKQAKEREKALRKEYERRTQLMKSQQTEEINQLKDDYTNKEISENDFQEKLYSLVIAHLGERKALMEEFGKDAADIQGQIYDKIIAETKRKMKELERLHKETMKIKVPDEEVKGDVDKESDDLVNQFNDGVIERMKKGKTVALDILKSFYEAGLISKKEYEEAQDRLEEEHEWTRAEKAKEGLQQIANFASSMSQLYQALQDKEVSKVTKKYDKEIKAAKKAGKDTTKLEEEKEAAVDAVKKKYADKQFAMSVLQIMATTAIAAMEAYASLAKIPVVGPALATIAMASALAAGAAQLVTAKQARDEAKGLKEGGYSDEYVEGYTTSGNPDDVAGVIPVHKNEFVGNHAGVANPHVKQFYDIFDVAQKNGTIHMINTTQILEQVKTKSGKYSGGYSTESNLGYESSNSMASSPFGNNNGEEMRKVIILLTESNRLLTIISEKELVVDPRDIKKGLNKLERLDANVSRH